ncbi:MAG: AAA family ATPase, partial [Candidatus Aminicenantes bacterium]|nr:AAA family ATPase [Candidatus Aminicenantes bacterium]
FAVLSTFWENSRPTEIDPLLLAGRIGGDGAQAFIADLLNGAIKLEPDAFCRRISELQRNSIAAQIRKKLRAQENLPDFDLTEIRPLLDELDNLNVLDEPKEPLSLILSNVEAKQVPWLWPNFIPLGRATLISGDPGSAKTWFCLDLASRLSRGLPWPDGSLGSAPAQTFYCTVEDDLHDTIRPRVDSLGGDPGQIIAFNSEQPLHLNLSQPDGLRRLETEIGRIGNVRLVVIDPIIDFSGDVTASFPGHPVILQTDLALEAGEEEIKGILYDQKFLARSSCLPSGVGWMLAEHYSISCPERDLGSDAARKEYHEPAVFRSPTNPSGGRAEYWLTILPVSADEREMALGFKYLGFGEVLFDQNVKVAFDKITVVGFPQYGGEGKRPEPRGTVCILVVLFQKQGA